jgi:hypothetical protein
MTQRETPDDTTDCGLHSFERNRFFHGKLMTARDMAAEQRYHRNRLRTLAEHVTGEGIVCGLETTVEAEGDSLVVTVEPGLALDSCGHPVVVETQAKPELDLSAVSDPTSLYLDYDSCVKETVPVPGAEDACEEECTYNRVLEIYDVSHEPDPPEDLKTVEAVEFPERGDLDSTDPRNPDSIAGGDDALREIARSYAEDSEGALRACDAGGDHRVFLGRFGTDGDGNWSRRTGVEGRPHVYTNDMLYAGLTRHAARFDDPHDVTAAQAGALVSVEGVSNPGGNVDLRSSDDSVTVAADDDANSVDLTVADRIQDQLSELGERVDDLEERLGGMERQLLKSTLHHKRLSFQLLAERFDADAAAAVAEAASAAIADGVHREPEAYLEFAEEALEPERAVAEQVAEREAVSEAALARYRQAVAELAAVLEGEVEDDLDRRAPEYVQRVARAQGLVAETAEWLDAGAPAEEPPPTEPTEDPQFTASTYTTESGETATIDLTTGDADEIQVQIGNEERSSYVLRARVEPGSHDRVTLTFDTASAGAPNANSLGVEQDVALEVLEETSLQGSLAASTYPMVLQVPGTRGLRRVDIATLAVREAEEEEPTGDLQSLQSSVEQKIEAFQEVEATIEGDAVNEIAAEIVQMSQEALDSGVHKSAADYRSFVASVLELELQLNRELVEASTVTKSSLGAYATAVKRLDNAVSEEADVQTLKELQNAVSTAALRLQPVEGGATIQPSVDPGSYTVSGGELEDVFRNEITSLEDAQASLAYEMARDDRTTAERVILNRISELEPSQ